MQRRLAIVALALLAMASAAGCGRAESRSGPLAPPPGETSIGLPVPVGKPFSDGLLVARNHGDKPAVLDRASFVEPDSGLKYVGAYVLSQPLRCVKVHHIPAPHACLFYNWKDRRGHLHTSRRSVAGLVAGFRVPRDGHALKGFTVVPGAEVVVVLGVMVTKPGRHRFNALALDYHVGRRAFRDIYSSSGQLCAPTRRYLNRCDAML